MVCSLLRWNFFAMNFFSWIFQFFPKLWYHYNQIWLQIAFSYELHIIFNVLLKHSNTTHTTNTTSIVCKQLANVFSDKMNSFVSPFNITPVTNVFQRIKSIYFKVNGYFTNPLKRISIIPCVILEYFREFPCTIGLSVLIQGHLKFYQLQLLSNASTPVMYTKYYSDLYTRKHVLTILVVMYIIKVIFILH